MNREQFLDIIKASLTTFTEEEKKEILYDYEEHFRIGIQNGETEEEIIKELGNPDDIAKQYKGSIEAEKLESNSNSQVKFEQRSIFPSIITALALGFFNLVFAIWIFIAAGATLFGLAAGAIAIVFSGVVVTLQPMLMPLFPNHISFPSNIPFDITLLFGIGTAALGVLFCIGLFYLMKYFYLATVKYIKWNISIIRR